MLVFFQQVASLVNIASNYLNNGWEAKRHGTAHQSIVPYQVCAFFYSYLRDWIHLVDFPPFFTIFVTYSLIFCTSKGLSEKGSTLTGKNLLPRGANSY